MPRCRTSCCCPSARAPSPTASRCGPGGPASTIQARPDADELRVDRAREPRRARRAPRRRRSLDDSFVRKTKLRLELLYPGHAPRRRLRPPREGPRGRSSRFRYRADGRRRASPRGGRHERRASSPIRERPPHAPPALADARAGSSPRLDARRASSARRTATSAIRSSCSGSSSALWEALAQSLLSAYIWAGDDAGRRASLGAALASRADALGGAAVAPARGGPRSPAGRSTAPSYQLDVSAADGIPVHRRRASSRALGRAPARRLPDALRDLLRDRRRDLDDRRTRASRASGSCGRRR